MKEEQNRSPISSAKDSGLGVIMFDSLLSHFSGNSQSENLDPALLKQMRQEFKNSEFFEVLVPYEYFDFGLKEPIKIVDGFAQLPEGPGLGIDLDWDFIDNSTF